MLLRLFFTSNFKKDVKYLASPRIFYSFSGMYCSDETKTVLKLQERP